MSRQASFHLADIVDLIHRLIESISAVDATASEVAAVAGGKVRDDGAPLGLTASAPVNGIRAVTVTRRWDSETPNTAELQLPPSLLLTDLEAVFGTGEKMVISKPGDNKFLLNSGNTSASIIVSTNEDNRVFSILIRRDI